MLSTASSPSILPSSILPPSSYEFIVEVLKRAGNVYQRREEGQLAVVVDKNQTRFLVFDADPSLLTHQWIADLVI